MWGINQRDCKQFTRTQIFNIWSSKINDACYAKCQALDAQNELYWVNLTGTTQCTKTIKGKALS